MLKTDKPCLNYKLQLNPEIFFMPNPSEDVLYKHHNAINTQDETEYLDSVKFPFTYQNYNGVSITIRDVEDYKVNYKMPWDIIKDTEENWSHTDMDNIEEVARSNSSVVYKLLMRRINQLGNTDLVIQVIWIAVFTKGKWGIQFRHNLGTPSPQN